MAAFMSPASIALLVAVLRRLDERGLIEPGSSIIPPKNQLLRNYLLRMDVLRQLGGIDIPEPFERREAGGFRPCLHFTGEADYFLVAKELAGALAEACVSEPIARASLYVTLAELTENVLNHAYTDLGGYAAAQRLKTKPLIEVASADLGVGIRGSLERNPEYGGFIDDAEAIDTALRPRVTSTPERNAGIGLFITSLLLRDNGGLLVARSGGGLVVRGAQEVKRVTKSNLPGTLVVLRARTDRPLEINAVYRQLDEMGITAED